VYVYSTKYLAMTLIQVKSSITRYQMIINMKITQMKPTKCTRVLQFPFLSCEVEIRPFENAMKDSNNGAVVLCMSTTGNYSYSSQIIHYEIPNHHKHENNTDEANEVHEST